METVQSPCKSNNESQLLDRDNTMNIFGLGHHIIISFFQNKTNSKLHQVTNQCDFLAFKNKMEWLKIHELITKKINTELSTKHAKP
jgi:hypothetical protein